MIDSEWGSVGFLSCDFDCDVSFKDPRGNRFQLETLKRAKDTGNCVDTMLNADKFEASCCDAATFVPSKRQSVSFS